MALEGVFALLCAGAALAAEPDPRETRSPAPVANTLQMQTALRQGREHLQRGDYRSAVYVLESHLARANGSKNYLDALADAYRGHIKELRLAKQDERAKEYLTRLVILDPGAVLDKALNAAAEAKPDLPDRPAAIPPVPAAAAFATRPTAPPPPRPTAPAPVVRMQGEEVVNDPFHTQNAADRAAPAAAASPALEALSHGDQAFQAKQYGEAEKCYERAYQADARVLGRCGEQWAYCKIVAVVRQLNQLPNPPLAQLEKEAQRILELAPRLDYGKQLLAEIRARQAATAEPAYRVRHGDRTPEGWQVAESDNFRVFHLQPPETAEQVARAAEKTRAEMARWWLGTPGESWNPKCDIYLHADAAAYSQATGQSATSPGHSDIRMDSGRVVVRRVHLRCDERSLLPAVLPHETTHIVLAGQFGDQPVPRWADEGMAVLAEPREKVERHVRNLARCRQEGLLLSARQIMELPDYPEPRYITAFYAQSVSLVDFLVTERGPQTLSAFLRDAPRRGYEPALREHYRMRDFNELQERWNRYLTGTATAQRTP